MHEHYKYILWFLFVILNSSDEYLSSVASKNLWFDIDISSLG